MPTTIHFRQEGQAVEIGTDVEKDGEFDQWCVLELMGHRRLAGRVTEAEIAGFKFLRIDIFLPGDLLPAATQFYAPGSVYGITPTTEESARRLARVTQISPVQPYELPSHDDDRQF